MSSSIFDSYTFCGFYPKVKNVGNGKPFSELVVGDTIYMYDTLKNKLYTLKVKYPEKYYQDGYRIGLVGKSPITYYRYSNGEGNMFVTDKGTIYSKYYGTDKESLLNAIIKEQEALIEDKEKEISNMTWVIERVKKHF